MPMTPLPPFIPFERPHRWETCAAQSNVIVFQVFVPRGQVAFIESIGNNLYENTEWELRIDNTVWSGRRIERVLGFINTPYIFNPHLLARKRIEMEAFNYNAESVEFECVINGFFGPVKEDVYASAAQKPT